jgi:hypothetical protein
MYALDSSYLSLEEDPDIQYLSPKLFASILSHNLKLMSK